MQFQSWNHHSEFFKWNSCKKCNSDEVSVFSIAAMPYTLRKIYLVILGQNILKMTKGHEIRSGFLFFSYSFILVVLTLPQNHTTIQAISQYRLLKSVLHLSYKFKIHMNCFIMIVQMNYLISSKTKTQYNYEFYKHTSLTPPSHLFHTSHALSFRKLHWAEAANHL